jgi:PAS domain S-box-containing protein
MPPDTMRAVLIVLTLFVVVQGAVIAWLLVQRVRRERAAQILRDGQEPFRLIADRAPVIIWTSTPQGTLDYINSTAAEFTGLSVDQLLKDGWHTAVHPDDMDGCLRTYLPAIEERRPFVMEFRARKGDGTYGWLLASGVPKYAPDGVYVGQIGASIEITDRKVSEEAHRESQQRLTMATAAGAVGVWDWNFVTNQLFVDSRLKSLLGFDDAEISTRPEDWGSRVHSEDLASAAALVQACVAGQSDVYELEHRMLHKNGSVKWFLSRGSAVRTADGVLQRLVGTKVDITERKRAAEQFRLAIEAAPAGMIMLNRAGTIVMVNAQVETLFGYQRSELIGKPIEMLVPGTADDGPATRELYGQRTDGTRVPIEVGVSRLETSEGQHVLLSVVDIAERQRSERENKDLLDQLQHLAGSLITAQDAERARIARDLHDDLSQQLAALSIALSGLKRRVAVVPQDAELQVEMASIQQRAVALAESVRDLSHDLHPDVLKHTGLAGALGQRCRELSHFQAMTITSTADGDVESIDDEAKHCLYRVAQEALHNAVRHACARHVEVRLLRADDIVELTVADDGSGFDVAAARKNRKGLGLVSINERVRLAGGTLSVVSEFSKGTQIRVKLPVGQHAGAQAVDVPRRFAAI